MKAVACCLRESVGRVFLDVLHYTNGTPLESCTCHRRTSSLLSFFRKGENIAVLDTVETSSPDYYCMWRSLLTDASRCLSWLTLNAGCPRTSWSSFSPTRTVREAVENTMSWDDVTDADYLVLIYQGITSLSVDSFCLFASSHLEYLSSSVPRRITSANWCP